MGAPGLSQLIGGYFHQDWVDEFETSGDAVNAFVRDSPLLARDLPFEIEALLARDLSDGDLEDYIDRLGNQYAAKDSEGGYRGWLAFIAIHIREQLVRAHPRALEHLMGAYFHQDWSFEYEDSEATVHDFVDDEPQLAALLPSEIDQVLTEHPSDEGLRAYLLSLGSCYTVLPGEGGYRGWLASIADRVRAATSHG